MLDESEKYMNYILAGIIIRYKVIDTQRDMIICKSIFPKEFDSKCFPDLFSMQAVSSLLVIYALLEFHKISQNVAFETKISGQNSCDADTEVMLSSIVILVAVIRYMQLLKNQNELENQNIEENVIDEEEFDLPI